MKFEDIIEKDKIKGVRSGFYEEVTAKIKRNKVTKNEFSFRRKHIAISIVAGIALGFLLGSIYNYTYKKESMEIMQWWIEKYHINDTKLECVEYKLFNTNT